MYNINNYAITSGRLVSDPMTFDNSDGSRKVKFTIAAPNNYKAADGTRGAQFVPVQAFLSKDFVAKNGNGVYDLIHKGDKVTVQSTIVNNRYTDKDGKEVYDLVFQIDNISLEEPKAVTQARAAGRAVEATEEAAK